MKSHDTARDQTRGSTLVRMWHRAGCQLQPSDSVAGLVRAKAQGSVGVPETSDEVTGAARTPPQEASIQNRHAGSKFLGPLVVLGESPLRGK